MGDQAIFRANTGEKKCNYVKRHVTVLLSEVNSRHSLVTTLKELKKKSNFIKDQQVCFTVSTDAHTMGYFECDLCGPVRVDDG